jgi:hypothetical protein
MNLKKLALFVLLLVFAFGFAARHFPLDKPAGGLEAAIVEEAAQRTPATASVILSPDVRSVVQEKHIAWHVVDQAAQGPDLAAMQWAIDAAKKFQKPVVVLRRGARTETYRLESAAALAALLKSRT